MRAEGSTIVDRDTMLRVATPVQGGRFAETKNAWHHLILDDPSGFVSTVTVGLDRAVAPPADPAGRS